MSIYKIKASGKGESIHHVNEFSLLKDDVEIWKIKSFYGSKYYEVITSEGDEYVMKNRFYLFIKVTDIFKNGVLAYTFRGKKLKLPQGKLWLDSRDFVYLNNEKICTIDLQRSDWKSGENVILKWEHTSSEFELPINLFGLWVLRFPTWQ